MKLFNSISLILLLFSNLSYSFNDHGHNRYEKNKTIKKEFLVNENATLSIDNKYGNLNIDTWNENKIEINIKIIVKGNSESNIDEKLNSIYIDFTANKSIVKAKTIIENKNSVWSFWRNEKNNTSFKIHYTVKIPANNNVFLQNKFGNIQLDDLWGKATINCSFGNIEIGKLQNSENNINLNYSEDSNIEYLTFGNISVDYSTLKIDQAEKLMVESDYSNIKFGNINSIIYNCDYGGISINSVVNLKGNSDYTRIKIDSLEKKLDIDTDFGNLKIQEIKKGFEKININASYASITLGTKTDNNFKFNVNISFASFSFPSKEILLNKKIKKSFKKYYEGKFGKNVSNSIININSSYGKVSLKKYN